MGSMDSRILADVLDLMGTLAGDWDYDGEISQDTLLLSEMGFESLDLVVLGTAIQERYGRLPFAQLLADIGQRESRDLSVGELVEFIERHCVARSRDSLAPGGTR